MVYEAICADFEWDRILELQRLAITTPRFNADELEAEKGNVRSELTGYLNNHNRVMWPRIQQALGEDILTYNQRLKTIANIELKDIKKSSQANAYFEEYAVCGGWKNGWTKSGY